MNAALAFEQSLPGISPGVYAKADFHAVARMVREQAGIVLPDGKAMLVYSRLAPLVREAGCGTFAAYIERIGSDHKEQTRAVAALTTNHTFFYRESHHFDHFERVVRPALLHRINRKETVRLWSAGCSSGEETWSLVLTLLGSDKSEGRRIARSDVRVLASDIAEHALRKARAATYPEKDLKALPSDLVRPWSTSEGGKARIVPEAQDLVRFRQLNLQGDWPMRGKFDTIFCRNVMIYFDNETKERLIARFAEALRPGAFLYIGHSERVTGPAAAILQPAGPTIYRRS
jgi:chemotaxis protein methyltransferase CheR